VWSSGTVLLERPSGGVTYLLVIDGRQASRRKVPQTPPKPDGSSGLYVGAIPAPVRCRNRSRMATPAFSPYK
jgi:hypothetical protein